MNNMFSLNEIDFLKIVVARSTKLTYHSKQHQTAIHFFNLSILVHRPLFSVRHFSHEIHSITYTHTHTLCLGKSIGIVKKKNKNNNIKIYTQAAKNLCHLMDKISLSLPFSLGMYFLWIHSKNNILGSVFFLSSFLLLFLFLIA